MWLQWYLHAFLGRSPFGNGCLDLKSFAFALLGVDLGFKSCTKKWMPKYLFEGCPPHTHQALDDAIGQGVLAVNLLQLAKEVSFGG
jgi:hypothetical protein